MDAVDSASLVGMPPCVEVVLRYSSTRLFVGNQSLLSQHGIELGKVDAKDFFYRPAVGAGVVEDDHAVIQYPFIKSAKTGEVEWEARAVIETGQEVSDMPTLVGVSLSHCPQTVAGLNGVSVEYEFHGSF